MNKKDEVMEVKQLKKFVILTNSMKDPDGKVSDQIQEYLTMRGRECTIIKADQKYEGLFHYTNPQEIPGDAECILVLGGDGTLLQAARDLVKLKIPLLGINMGTLGFLAEVEKTMMFPALDMLMRGEYYLEERMMLSGKLYRGEQLLGEDIALNDIVISREGALRVINFINFVNDIYLNSYNADGIIISTPTGSTGYSLSAGGPIVSPSSKMIMMTPLAPHTLNSRSIILDGGDKITVELGAGRRTYMEKGMVSYDGDSSFSMMTGDKIVIEQADVNIRIVKLSNQSFLEVLRKKMSND